MGLEKRIVAMFTMSATICESVVSVSHRQDQTRGLPRWAVCERCAMARRAPGHRADWSWIVVRDDEHRRTADEGVAAHRRTVAPAGRGRTKEPDRAPLAGESGAELP